MKTAIVCYSQLHGNTRKLLDAIAEKNEVTIIDVVRDKDADEILKAVEFYEGLK